MRRGLITCIALTSAMIAPGMARAQEFEAGHVVPCFEAAPSSLSIATTPVIDVHVHVVLDEGVSLETGRAMVERARDAYAPLGLNLRPSFTTTRTTSDEAADLMTHLKGLFGGARPPWAHAVYLLTKRDFRDGANDGVAGQADCLGGVAFDEHAFAIGKAAEDLENAGELGPLSFSVDKTARIHAHEVGHLFGAHHHYAECATAMTRGGPAGGPCTLMAPDMFLSSLHFSGLNGAIVRGHANSYMKPITVPPPPDGSPSVPPHLRPCDIVSHRDIRGDHALGLEQDPVDIDLLRGTFLTGPDGVVRFRWTVAELTGAFIRSTVPHRYWLQTLGPKQLRFEVLWDGTSAPVARAFEGQTALADLRVTMVTGTDGYFEVELPLGALGLAGPLQPGRLSVLTGVLLEDGLEYDQTMAAVPVIEPGPCATRAGDAAAPGEAGGPGEAMLPVARVELLDRSARRKRLRVRVHGDLRAVRVRLLDRRGRAVAAGRAARVSGARVIALRAKRELRRGGHRLTLSGRDGAGRTVKQSVKVRLTR